MGFSHFLLHNWGHEVRINPAFPGSVCLGVKSSGCYSGPHSGSPYSLITSFVPGTCKVLARQWRVRETQSLLSRGFHSSAGSHHKRGLMSIPDGTAWKLHIHSGPKKATASHKSIVWHQKEQRYEPNVIKMMVSFI